MTPQEQAFHDWFIIQRTFGADYLEIWNEACKWQREQIQSYLIADNQGYFIGSNQYDEVFDK